MNEIRKSSVVRQGSTRVIEIPEGLDLPEGPVTIRQQGRSLVVEPEVKAPASLREFFDNLEPVDIDWPDVDEGLLPLDDIKL